MKYIYLLCFLCLIFFSSLHAQMPINGQISYGNEWIRYDQPYVKIPVAQDGVYRVSYNALLAAGFPISTATAAQIQLWHFGAQIPIYISTEGSLSSNDFIEFYGKKNRGELDRFLYKNGEADMLNPAYSLFTDTAVYYLTVAPLGTLSKHYQTIETDLSNLPQKEAWYQAEEASVQTGGFVENANGDILESIFEPGEGWGTAKGINSAFQVTLQPSNRYSGPNQVPDNFQIRYTGIGTNSHFVQLSINNAPLGQIGSRQNGMKNEQFSYAPSSLESKVDVRLIDTSGRIAISFVKLFYQRTFNFLNRNQFYFKLTGNNTEKFLEIESFLHRNVLPILYDLTSGKRIITHLSSGKVQVKLERFTGEHEFLLMNPNEGFTTGVVQQVALPNFPEQEKTASYIIITSRKLRGEAVQAYVDYRTSSAGGNYKVAVINVEDLYEQFAYGVQRHPLAIRNFGHYVKENWRSAKFVFILGKGQEFNANTIRSYTTTAADARFFIPTFGYPGSDNLLLASNDSQVPVLPIGRLAATKPSDVELYLEKIKTYENHSTDNRSWRKDVIHLGGGKKDNEQADIERYMDEMQNIIQNNSFGANVNRYYKKSTDVTQQLGSDKINELIQRGVGLITFFGHGGPTLIDISIGDAKNFTNYDQYPVMFALGCLAGNIFISDDSYSESFVLQPNRGGIAFVGTSGEELLPDLGNYQRTVYRNLADRLYGKSLGEILQASIKAEDANSSPGRRMLLQQFVLHGDPAIIMNPYDAPDYLIEKESIQFDPTQVSIRDNHFDLKFNVLNIGKNIPDSLSIAVIRKLPDGKEKKQRTKIKAPAFRSENPITFQFPVTDSSSTAGFNNFSLVLDPDDKIAELPSSEAEVNNQETKQLFIFDQGITPVEPQNYAIINTAPFQLSASTANVFESEQTYRFEIDTTQLFNSLLRKDTLFTAIGGVLVWKPSVKLLDSVVYYWRVSVDSSSIEGMYNWSTSSFTYIKDSPLGWRQGHFQQLQENALREMELPDSTRQLSFAFNPSNVELRDFVITNGGIDNVSINTTTNEYVGGINNGGVTVCVFDGKTGTPWHNPYPGLYGSVIGASWATWHTTFPYSTRSDASRKKLINFLKDTIPDGNYVLLFTIQHTNTDYEPNKWAADSLTNNGINLFNLLGKEGATKIRQTTDSIGARPYAIFYRKGMSTPLFFELLTESANDTIFKPFKVPGFKTEGSLTSRRIGPAHKWARLQQQFKTDETDHYDVDLYGSQKEGDTPIPLLRHFTGVDTSLEWISAAQYPYLELQLNAHDTVNRTPAQLQYWQVLYDGVPEAALNPLVHYTLPKDTLQEGDSLALRIAISNLSSYDMDRLLVHYMTTSGTNQVRLDSIRLKPLSKQDTLIFNLTLPTQGLRGKQQLAIEINPTENKPDQPELYHFNNIGFLDFYVQSDVRNPLVDVTFDGIRILNGDLVSAKPQIVVALRDENLYLPLIDTSTVELTLRYPDETERLIPYSDLRFEPGKLDSKGSKATIYYDAEFTQDGTYTLSIKGRDISGNEAGKIAYEVEFEVITKAMISNVFNYPNPFTTSTQFVYTLTGTEPPAQYKIQIMSVSGRIVRELTELDLGPLHIGMHRTELAWDGRDQYGDRLANGVYLYRVIAKDAAGKDYEKYNDGNDTVRFFKKNIGKLVILR